MNSFRKKPKFRYWFWIL